ncbi:MAG: hypothetical protein HY360_26735 [Verrucomicrobia bacterium]|nr:hypothetical protein [Verrucomicrobiota bacterium]
MQILTNKASGLWDGTGSRLGGTKHQISVLDESGHEVEKWTAVHTAEGLRQAIERLAKRQADGHVLVAIETPHGLFVEVPPRRD